MNILNDILLVAGALFVIAMVLICLGLFMNPKKKQNDELDEILYYKNIETDRRLNTTELEENDDEDADEDSDNMESEDAVDEEDNINDNEESKSEEVSEHKTSEPIEKNDNKSSNADKNKADNNKDEILEFIKTI